MTPGPFDLKERYEMSTSRYFSEREAGEAPRTEASISSAVWGGIVALIRSRIDDGSFGARYPQLCPDGAVPCGTDDSSFWKAMRGEVPDLPETPQTVLNEDEPPSLLLVMDVVEFCWQAVGKPISRGYHSYHKHHHFDFDIDGGRQEFQETVNRIFRRNGLVFELTDSGEVQRLAPAVLHETLEKVLFSTGDSTLDEMLETARRKFFDPDEAVRHEGLEKLWDAWERVKTLEEGASKPGQIKALLDRVAETDGSKFRDMLEREARELTNLGNTFQIRHTETTQEPLKGSDEMDYLFHRLFSFIRLVIRKTGRGG